MAISELLSGITQSDIKRVDAVLAEEPIYGPFLYELVENPDMTSLPSHGSNEISGQTLFTLPTPDKPGAQLSDADHKLAESTLADFLSLALEDQENRKEMPTEIEPVPIPETSQTGRTRPGELFKRFYDFLPFTPTAPKPLSSGYGHAD